MRPPSWPLGSIVQVRARPTDVRCCRRSSGRPAESVAASCRRCDETLMSYSARPGEARSRLLRKSRHPSAATLSDGARAARTIRAPGSAATTEERAQRLTTASSPVVGRADQADNRLRPAMWNGEKRTAVSVNPIRRTLGMRPTITDASTWPHGVTRASRPEQSRRDTSTSISCGRAARDAKAARNYEQLFPAARELQCSPIVRDFPTRALDVAQ